MDELLLKDVVYENCPDDKVFDWPFLPVDKVSCDWRLYYKRQECFSCCDSECDKKHGFYFTALEWAGNNAHEPMWSGNTTVEVTYWGVAMFDGIRHVFFGNEHSNDRGYQNYPKPITHLRIWLTLEYLSKQFCRE